MTNDTNVPWRPWKAPVGLPSVSRLGGTLDPNTRPAGHRGLGSDDQREGELEAQQASAPDRATSTAGRTKALGDVGGALRFGFDKMTSS